MYSYNDLVKNKDIRRIIYVLVPFGDSEKFLFPSAKSDKKLFTSKGKVRSNGSFLFKNTELRDVINDDEYKTQMPLKLDPLKLPKLEVMLYILGSGNIIEYEGMEFPSLFKFTDVAIIAKADIPKIVKSVQSGISAVEFNNIISELALQVKPFSQHIGA